MPLAAPLRLAISQGHGGSTVLEGARLFAKALGGRLNQTVRLAVAEGYAALYRMLLSKGCELAWVPPFLHMAAIPQGARIAAVCERHGSLTYRSAMLVSAESALKTIADLRRPGLSVAWSDPNSAAGYVFPRMYLLSQGIDPSGFEEKFVGSPLACCAAVADKQADLCPCFVSELSAEDPARVIGDVRRVYAAAPWRLRVLGITDAIPSDAMMLAPGMDAELGERITEAMLGFHTHPDGREALAKLLYADKLLAPTHAFMAQIEILRPHMPPVEP